MSDLGHTAFSHMGDWLFQGFGGSENQHDQELPELLKAGDIDSLLFQYGIPLEEVVSPDTQDWIAAGLEANVRGWPKVLKRPRMDSQRRTQLFHDAAITALTSTKANIGYCT